MSLPHVSSGQDSPLSAATRPASSPPGCLLTSRKTPLLITDPLARCGHVTKADARNAESVFVQSGGRRRVPRYESGSIFKKGKRVSGREPTMVGFPEPSHVLTSGHFRATPRPRPGMGCPVSRGRAGAWIPLRAASARTSHQAQSPLPGPRGTSPVSLLPRPGLP